MAGDTLLSPADDRLNDDAMPYGEVVALNRELMDQMIQADITRQPIDELTERQAALQAANPGAFRAISQAALADTF